MSRYEQFWSESTFCNAIFSKLSLKFQQLEQAAFLFMQWLDIRKPNEADRISDKLQELSKWCEIHFHSMKNDVCMHLKDILSQSTDFTMILD